MNTNDPHTLRVDAARVAYFKRRAGIVPDAELVRRAKQHGDKFSKFTLDRMLSGENTTLESIRVLAIALECHPYDIIIAEGYPAPHFKPQAVGVNGTAEVEFAIT